MTFRPHSSMPKLSKTPCFDDKKRTSVPGEALKTLFESDYCYTVSQNRTQNEPLLKINNFKQKLFNFLKKKNETEASQESSCDKITTVKKKPDLYSPKLLSSTRFGVNNDYLLGSLRSGKGGVRKRKEVVKNGKGNSKLESTNASSNVTTTAKDGAGQKKINHDPIEEFYKSFF